MEEKESPAQTPGERAHMIWSRFRWDSTDPYRTWDHLTPHDQANWETIAEHTKIHQTLGERMTGDHGTSYDQRGLARSE